MKPKQIGRLGSKAKIFTSRSFWKRHVLNMKRHGVNVSDKMNVPKRLKKLWHARMRRHGREQVEEQR